MKKVLIIFVLLFGLSVNAEIPAINFKIAEDVNINKQLECIEPILDEAGRTKNEDLYIKAAVKGYKLNKKGDVKIIKQYNDMFSATIIGYALQRYDLTKNNKYLKIAHKWAKIAIDDRTEQIYAIKAGIMISAQLLDKDTLIKSYDLLRCIDEKEADKYYNDYQKLLSQVDQSIKYNRELRNQRIIYGLQVMGSSMQAAGNSMGASRPVHYTTTQVGNTLYTTGY